MNCFSSGREVRRRCKSVPRSSVTEICQRSRIRKGWRVHLPTYMSSRGEMKMSLKLMTCCLISETAQIRPKRDTRSYVLMAQMLEKLQLAVCALGQNGCAEGLHDLFDRDGRCGELVLCRTICSVSLDSTSASCTNNSPDKSESTHAHRLQIRISDVAVSPGCAPPMRV